MDRKILAIFASMVALSAQPGMAASGGTSFKCFGQEATIVGTAEDDTLRGTPGRDVIVGLGGIDEVWAGGGPDLVCLGPGGRERKQETVGGGKGGDRLSGGSGADVLTGEEGKDLLVGGAGPDSLRGREEKDLLKGGRDRDFLFGQQANDRLEGGAGSDIMEGGQGDDHLRGGKGSVGGDLVMHGLDQGGVDSTLPGVKVNLLKGWARGAGKDTLRGIENAVGTDRVDRLIGDEKNNVLQALYGDDVLKGDQGNDCLNPGGDNNKAFGGPGEDYYSTSAHPYLTRFDCIRDPSGGDLRPPLHGAGPVVVDLKEGTATDNFETSLLFGIEGAFGTSWSDVLTGDSGPNYLHGGPSNDEIYGRAGNDVLDGAGGTDRVDGGLDTDECLDAEVTFNCE